MKPLSRRSYALAAIVLAVAVFLGLNIAVDATITNARLDLTENGRFTLSQGTRNIVRNLREPVTLRFFFSKQTAAEYAQTRAYAGRVRDLLREYASRSDGKIIFEEIDPQPYTPAEDQAAAAGITGVPTETGETVYFGLLGSNRIDGREAIPYFSPDREGLLEYDITTLITRLSSPKKNRVAIVSSLPLDTGPGGMQAAMAGRSRPVMLYSELAQAYDTQMLPPDFAAVPAGTDVLMIVQPGNLSDAQVYAIDQYVLKGGHALVFVDPNSELAQQSAGGMDPGAAAPSSSLPRLFQTWGIAFDTGKEIGDRKLAQRVQASREGATITYPIWLHTTRDQFSDSDPVTASLQTVNLASAGSLRPLKSATTKFASLIGSSNQASLVDVTQARLMAMTSPDDLSNLVSPTGDEYIIAARITGPAGTAFPSGPPAGATGRQTMSAKNINVIVMADTDIFDDRFWVRIEQMFGKTVAAPFANNDAFVINALENLTGSNELISLRTRARNDRPFTLVRALQADAERQFKQQEDALKARLSETEQQLKNLQTGQGAGAGSSVAITPQQEAAIVQFKRQLSEIRTQLREVQRNLRQDVDALGNLLAFVNTALVPILVALFAIALAWLRRRRRARAIHL
jgi:ABC-type uncharacterized transport system involved in gliding motility auxiliary subunit